MMELGRLGERGPHAATPAALMPAADGTGDDSDHGGRVKRHAASPARDTEGSAGAGWWRSAPALGGVPLPPAPPPTRPRTPVSGTVSGIGHAADDLRRGGVQEEYSPSALPAISGDDANAGLLAQLRRAMSDVLDVCSVGVDPRLVTQLTSTMVLTAQNLRRHLPGSDAAAGANGVVPELAPDLTAGTPVGTPVGTPADSNAQWQGVPVMSASTPGTPPTPGRSPPSNGDVPVRLMQAPVAPPPSHRDSRASDDALPSPSERSPERLPPPLWAAKPAAAASAAPGAVAGELATARSIDSGPKPPAVVSAAVAAGAAQSGPQRSPSPPMRTQMAGIPAVASLNQGLASLARGAGSPARSGGSPRDASGNASGSLRAAQASVPPPHQTGGSQHGLRFAPNGTEAGGPEPGTPKLGVPLALGMLCDSNSPRRAIEGGLATPEGLARVSRVESQ
ncbi:unnamed protein product [Pedinophyceae sp. YPF-701]|nr:unnamed protein product [Pedinophyceae sp. YPF-701]